MLTIALNEAIVTTKKFPGSLFVGKFELIHQENFYDEYLRTVGKDENVVAHSNLYGY